MTKEIKELCRMMGFAAVAGLFGFAVLCGCQYLTDMAAQKKALPPAELLAEKQLTPEEEAELDKQYKEEYKNRRRVSRDEVPDPFVAN